MNNKKINTDDFTKELISKVEIQQPGPDFTKRVMNRILKDPSVKVNFITDDDRRSNIWLIISMSIMVIGFFLFYFIKYGLNFSLISKDFQGQVYLKAFTDFFSEFWNELSLSPYILIALIGVLFLVFIDKAIVKYLHSI